MHFWQCVKLVFLTLLVNQSWQKLFFLTFLTPSYFTRINMPQTLDEQTQYILRMKSGAQKWLFSPKKARKMDKNLIFWTKIDLTKLKLILINWNTNLRITSNFWNHNRLSLVSSVPKTSAFWARKPPKFRYFCYIWQLKVHFKAKKPMYSVFMVLLATIKTSTYLSTPFTITLDL